MDELKKIDLIRERIDVNYLEAREALERSNGDVVAALIDLEHRECNWEQKLEKGGHRLWSGFKSLLHLSHKTKVKVIKDGDTVLEMPGTVGAIALLGVLANTELTIVAGLGTMAAVLNGCHLELEGHDEKEKDEYIIIS